MESPIQVTLLAPQDWPRLRDIRLKSLEESPDAFGATLEAEKAFSEIDWCSKFINLDYLVASINSKDIAIMSIEVLDGDHGATCWIGSCWSEPKFRGQGAFRALFKHLDSNCISKGWQRQGLGVWTDNVVAIAAYRALGFVAAGDEKASERHPGRFYMHMIRDCSGASLHE